MNCPVVFLDKDGTLIEDLPYNVDPARIRFAPGARSAMRRLAATNLTVAREFVAPLLPPVRAERL